MTTIAVMATLSSIEGPTRMTGAPISTPRQLVVVDINIYTDSTVTHLVKILINIYVDINCLRDYTA